MSASADYSYTEAAKRREKDAQAAERGETIERFRIVEVNEYLGREEEWGGLSLGEAAIKMDDLTGVGADLILSDFDEDCAACEGKGEVPTANIAVWEFCTACHGIGKRREPWTYNDDETGREVTLMRETD